MIEKSSATNGVKVRVTRCFDAAPEKVFDAWLDPEHIGSWMFGPSVRDEEIIHLNVDPRIGGKFSFYVRRGDALIDHVGTYRVIDDPRRLAFTWGIAGDSEEESVVTIEIEPTQTGCELTVTHDMDAKWSEYADRTQAGWTTMLNTLAKMLGEK